MDIRAIQSQNVGVRNGGDHNIERYNNSPGAKEKHPRVPYLRRGPSPNDENFISFGPNYVAERYIVDEHYYMAPSWFSLTLIAMTITLYGSEVFAGEYAAQSVGIASRTIATIGSALAAAAFVTDLNEMRMLSGWLICAALRSRRCLAVDAGV